MARGTRGSPVATLPKVSFEKVEDDVSTQPGGVHDQQARSYGYNDFSLFRRPEYYIRHIEPLESDLAKQVEYDMDEQDQEWLDAVNGDRKKEQLNKVSYEVFEIVMDRLEKEWFDLTKNIPKMDLAMPSEDSTCAVCDDSEGENSNAIVFCDGCNLAVHQDCYGVPYIPEGQWLCRKCTVSPENPVQCILCPNEAGAFKQTVHGEWVHLLCAIWVPETRVANEVFMEPITGIEKISKQRWKLKCSICDIREGACIQCAKHSCFLAFHATCARREKLLLPMKSTQGSEPVTLTCYCERHLPQEQADVRIAALATEASQDVTISPNNNSKHSSKSARAYAKTYKPGPPLVPTLIVNRIMNYIAKVALRKKHDFVLMMCRYWSLKREARRGAPLLKRLHLEPWTANAVGNLQSDEDRAMKLEQLRRLKQDLENVRVLAELCRKRETRKLRQMEILRSVLNKALFPHEPRLRMALDKITSHDRNEYFRNPVSKTDVPDYFDIVKKPMCWSMIEEKLDRHEYWDLAVFKNDVNLVVNNAILYNKAGTPFHKTALRIQTAAEPILKELFDSLAPPVAVPPSPVVIDQDLTAMDVDNHSDDGASIGDLEPPLDVLQLLTSTDAIKDDLDIILTTDPIVSLYNYELARIKPPPPPPPPPPRKPRKQKRDRKAEYERAKANRQAAAAAAAASQAEAMVTLQAEGEVQGLETSNERVVEQKERGKETQATLNESPGFRLPRTRRAAAVAAAHEVESSVSYPEEPILEATSSTSVVESPVEPAKRVAKKRASLSTTGQTGAPHVVSAIDNRDSFNLFHHGWILPPEQKRGGRAPVSRPALPPPKKRLKVDAPTSQLSSYSTTASENQTLKTLPALEGSLDIAFQLKADNSMDVDKLTLESNLSETSVSQVQAVASAEPSSTTADFVIPKGTIVEAPNGTIIIEELDTPAIRRQKNLLKKAEKLRLAATEAPSSIPPPSHVDTIAPISEVPSTSAMLSSATPNRSIRVQKVKGKDEFESDLSSLSEFGSEEDKDSLSAIKCKTKPPSPTTPTQEQPAPRLNAPRVSTDRAAIVLPEDKLLEGGTLVWAKADSFPWWPAVIFEDDDPSVPLHILNNCKLAREKRNTKIHLLQFFDKSHSWQYLPLDRLKLLGEDTVLDEEMLSRKQKWKSSTVKSECRAAYSKAMSEMETRSDVEGDASQNANPDVEAVVT